MRFEFIDKYLTIKFNFQKPKFDFWNQWANDGIKFENAWIDGCDVRWGTDYEIGMHSDTLYFEHFRKERNYELISEEPITRELTPLQYSAFTYVTKMAVMQRIWRNKLPLNVKATKKENGEYLLKIN